MYESSRLITTPDWESDIEPANGTRELSPTLHTMPFALGAIIFYHPVGRHDGPLAGPFERAGPPGELSLVP